jgi:hypothetical protein
MKRPHVLAIGAGIEGASSRNRDLGIDPLHRTFIEPVAHIPATLPPKTCIENASYIGFRSASSSTPFS